ncbi:hypothetical protein DUI70_1103 [Streptomyces albus]|nr:hypothetical protein DUI70_1103 [Streptomyces albus]
MINDHSDRELDALLARADRAVLDAVSGGLDVATGLRHFPAPPGPTPEASDRHAPRRQSDPPGEAGASLAEVLHTIDQLRETVSRGRAEWVAVPPRPMRDVRTSLVSQLGLSTQNLIALREGLGRRRLSESEARSLITRAAARFEQISLDLVGVAASSADEQLYWQAVEWIDKIDELQDRLLHLARVVPRLFDDADDRTMNPVFL